MFEGKLFVDKQFSRFFSTPSVLSSNIQYTKNPFYVLMIYPCLVCVILGP